MFTRFRKWLDRKLSNRYYEHVPEKVRQLAEKNDAPEPNRFVPSALGGSPSPAELRNFKS